mgnify:CR=1 FL=1|tara:strand:- start:2552 stop:2980 length:429 start_codon:yes stop_codon:yes gene_type:complete
MDSPAPDLNAALARMTWRLEPGTFVLVGFQGPASIQDLESLRPPGQIVVEDDETSLLVGEAALPGILERHPDARIEADLLWITFEAPMGWEVVGFLARVTGALAEAGIPIGAVCGYSRDHLFVARRHREQAERVLRSLFPSA